MHGLDKPGVFTTVSLKTSDLTDFLKRFGVDYKNRFRQELDKNQRAETFFNNLVTNQQFPDSDNPQ